MKLKEALHPDILEFSKEVHPIIWNIIVIACAILLGLVIKFVVTRLLHYYAKKQNNYSFFRSVIIHIGTPLTYFIQFFLLGIALPLLIIEKVYYQPTGKAIGILLTIAFANLLIKAIRVLEDYIYHKYDLNKTDNLKERKIRTQIQFIRKLIVAVVVFLTVAVILLSFESMRRIGTGLLTGVGIGGIIIGFAAQSSLGNLLAGFQIAFTQPMRIDDVLVVENESGRVEDITLTYVVLRLWDQRRLILPINYFIQNPFQNWTRMSADLLGTVMLYMDYTIPIDDLKVEFNRLVESSPLWDKKAAGLQVTDCKESTIEVRALVSAQNSSDLFDLRCFIRENLIIYIQKNYPGSLPKVRTEVANIEKLFSISQGKQPPANLS